jgi:serine protease Do
MVKPKKPLPWVEFGDSDAVHVGDWVLAIGNPFGLGGTVTTGIVSARNRDINAGPYDDFIQTDAAINKGNSGGPLFDMKGRVIGVNSAILSPTGGSVGIGFAIPSNLAKRVVDQLVKYGETRRGWLGVRIQTITDELAEGLGLKSPEGALVTEVTPGGPAAKAGIRPRDVIISFHGRLVHKMRELPRLVAETPVGEEVPVTVIRDGREVRLKVTLGRLEEAEKKGLLSKKGRKEEKKKAAPETVLGMTLAALDDTVRKEKSIPSSVKSGLVVLKVAPESQAAEKGLMPGDVIAEAGGRVLKSVADLQAALRRMRTMGRKAIPLLVLRKANNYEPQFVALKLKP